MPNEKDVNKIIQRLNTDQDTELMYYDLEQMLDHELAKPASQMDVQLVQELLSALEEEPSEHDKQAIWKSIEKRARRSAGRQSVMIARRIVASVLILFVVSFAFLGSAYAFNWTFLLKFLKPLAETFGIYSSNNFNTVPPEQSEIALYTDEDTGFEQVVYDSAEDMPVEWDGFRVQPAWMPERFSFIQGSLYEDDSVAMISVSYMANEDFFNLSTTFFSNDEDVSSYEYHKTQGNPTVETIAGQEVAYYLNSDDCRLSASWINQNAHYCVFGDITEDEMRDIVRSMVE